MPITITESAKICEELTESEAKDLLRLAVDNFGRRNAVIMFKALVYRCNRESAINTVIDLLYAGIIPKYSPVAVMHNRKYLNLYNRQDDNERK